MGEPCHASKTLAACYSHSGHTKTAAEAVAKGLGADLEQIVPLNQSPNGAIGTVQASVCVLFRQSWTVRPTSKTSAAYDLVVIYAPVWAFHLPLHAQGAIAFHDVSLKTGKLIIDAFNAALLPPEQRLAA